MDVRVGPPVVVVRADDAVVLVSQRDGTIDDGICASVTRVST